METIVVPLDEFPLSEAAVPVAAGIARRLGANLHLVEVSSSGIDPMGPEMYLAEQAKRVAGPVTTAALFGDDVVAALVDYLEAHPRSMVCMGAHGRTGVARVLGSVSEGVIRESRWPVIIVGPHAGNPTTINRILVCLDRSRLAETVLPSARQLAVALDADLELFHVDTALDGASLADLAYLDGIARSIDDVRVHIGHTGGVSAGRSITKYSADNNIGLIALSTHARSGLAGAFLGSVAQQVVHHAPCPVLIYHPRGMAL